MYMYILVYGEKRKDDGNVVAQQFCKQVTFSKTVVFFFFFINKYAFLSCRKPMTGKTPEA